MRTSREEILNPGEWLRQVVRDDEQLLKLLLGSGGLARAAYRLARAQCRACDGVDREPTLGELKLAARVIAHRTGRDSLLPIEPAQPPPRSDPKRCAAPTPPSRRAAQPPSEPSRPPLPPSRRVAS